MSTPLLDLSLIEEIKRIERATGKNDVLSGFVVKLEGNLAAFGNVFGDLVARGDGKGAVRAAHTLKGTCRQLGAVALGELFEGIEASAKAGDYAAAKQKYEAGKSLIAESVEALKRA